MPACNTEEVVQEIPGIKHSYREKGMNKSDRIAEERKQRNKHTHTTGGGGERKDKGTPEEHETDKSSLSLSLSRMTRQYDTTLHGYRECIRVCDPIRGELPKVRNSM